MTYILPLTEDQPYLAAILNSSLIEFFFLTISVRARGDYLRFFTEQVKQLPIRHIEFTTPQEERVDLTRQGVELFQTKRYAKLLTLIDICLQHQPEQSDVVHDIIGYLGAQIIDFHKQRQTALENFMLGLESILSDEDLQKLSRLWTPPAETLEYEKEQNLKEATTRLGTLATQTIVLRDHIGQLDEEQWKWLLKRRLLRPDLVDLVRVYRKYQPAIAALDQQIAEIDDLINQCVYRLYGLTPEEISVVERKDE